MCACRPGGRGGSGPSDPEKPSRRLSPGRRGRCCIHEKVPPVERWFVMVCCWRERALRYPQASPRTLSRALLGSGDLPRCGSLAPSWQPLSRRTPSTPPGRPPHPRAQQAQLQQRTGDWPDAHRPHSAVSCTAVAQPTGGSNPPASAIPRARVASAWSRSSPSARRPRELLDQRCELLGDQRVPLHVDVVVPPPVEVFLRASEGGT